MTAKRTALVTGANRGLGLAVARELARLGNRVFLGSRDAKAGQAAVDPLFRAGLEVVPVTMDLQLPGTIDAGIGFIERTAGPLDVLVNNAGVLNEDPLLELTEATIAESLAVHLTGPLRLIQRVAPGMVEGGYGRIVNVSSEWGSFAAGLGGPGAYGITKAALNALTVRLSKELPATVKVNAMCPGWVRTRMGGAGAARSPDEAADTAVWLATLPGDGPTGRFFKDRKPIDW